MTPAGGGFYEATIPGQDAGTTVHFKVWANDTLGNPSESSEHGYTVTTPDTEGPTIVNITASPSEPREGEDITIGADVADPSGVDEVILSYSTDGGTTWENTTMTHTSGNRYEGTVPGQAAGTTITYKIYARDSVGNWAVSDEHTITVRSAGILPPQIMGVPTLFPHRRCGWPGHSAWGACRLLEDEESLFPRPKPFSQALRARFIPNQAHPLYEPQRPPSHAPRGPQWAPACDGGPVGRATGHDAAVGS